MINKNSAKWLNTMPDIPQNSPGSSFVNSTPDGVLPAQGGLAQTAQRFDVLQKVKEFIVGDGDTGIKMVDGQMFSGGKTLDTAITRWLNTGTIFIKDINTGLDQVMIGKFQTT